MQFHNTFARTRSYLCLAAVISTAALGCTMPQEPSELDEPGENDIGEIQQASVGDMACTTVSPLVSPDGISAAITADPHCSIAFQTFTSPNTSYDWSPNACGQSYVAQITGTTGRAFSFVVSDGGPALDKDSCPLVGVAGAAHGRRVSDGQWVLIGKTVLHGEWHSGPFINGCFFVEDDNSGVIPPVTGTGANNYSRVRVEGVSVGFIFFKRRVTVGISHGTGPC